MSVNVPHEKANTLASAVAVLVAIVFLALSAWLIYFFDEWHQVTVVYNAVCAIAFSAFGVLLGSKVQEANVTRAVQTAEQASREVQIKTEAIKAAATTLSAPEADDESGGGHQARRARADALSVLMASLH